MRNSPQRGLIICLFVIAMSILNFSRLKGSECIRPIHIVTLLTAGAGIGVMIVNIFMLIRRNNSTK
jgi:hypothetical protein